MSKEQIIYTNQDFELFKDWLNLDINAITWQGKNKSSFYEFWDHFFSEGLSLVQVIKRFEFLQRKISVGPISSWFIWLRNRFICFTFINKDISVNELSSSIELSVGEVSLILRDYFVEQYPHLEVFFSDTFQMAHSFEEKANLKFELIKKEAFTKSQKDKANTLDVMTQMEITLYDEWTSLLDTIKRELVGSSLQVEKKYLGTNFSSQFNFIRDGLILVIISVLLALTVKHINIWYGQKIIDQISIYEPKFEWLDKSIIFKPKEIADNVQIDFRDIEDVPDAAPFNVEFKEEERFDTESEVEITSWDQLPKDIEVADSEVSEYEEFKNTGSGYRDFRYGNTTVFRVMMKSANTKVSREKLKKLMSAYNVTQVDNVKPGLDVPGGIYFNIFVPREYIKEFLSQVMEVDRAILYESKTRTTRNPPGKNKVFIWVKSI